ncbi:putative het-domain-containing protein [Botrytis fragariae]|uniref:Putative het-domain-containing protein n=1 Tax=Botrytis fragariae TaxID=1964551 RepID=A0A8H6AUK5_9HELO|nr:putative het-domain-containing protein [Botrytis fragariae]KAF5873922.1 putative het-domain-containing protein [Botrytis fragariae]
MDCTTSSYVPSDDCEENDMSEEEIHEAVLAAGKKAKNISLCEKCDQIVGWFFLEQKVFRGIIRREGGFPQLIYNFKIDELKLFCKLCNFFHSIRIEEAYEDEEYFSLARSTAG